jgi:hypothetical protein
VGQNALSDLVVQIHNIHAHPYSSAGTEQDVGRAVGDQHQSVRMIMVLFECGHQLAFEVKGISPTRSERCSRRLVAPSLRSATKKAASVGSPSICQSPSHSRRFALLARLSPLNDVFRFQRTFG